MFWLCSVNGLNGKIKTTGIDGKLFFVIYNCNYRINRVVSIYEEIHG